MIKTETTGGEIKAYQKEYGYSLYECKRILLHKHLVENIQNIETIEDVKSMLLDIVNYYGVKIWK